MKVPVLWVGKDDRMARGYWDQGMIEAIMARRIWEPPDAIEFEHIEVTESFPNVAGALVLVPCRHHADRETVDWLKDELARLKWSVVILCGDEEWVFPWQEIEQSDTRKVWAMQPIPGHEALSWNVPGGPYPDTWGQLPEVPVERDLPWFFGGQVTHERREECVKVLRDLPHSAEQLHETEGYLQGMPREEYFGRIARARVVPSPSGPCHVDTARTFEALEAGAIPVVDCCSPNGRDFDYWKLLFRTEEVPFPMVTDWADFPTILDDLNDGWQSKANRAAAFWQAYKRDTALKLDDDLRSVSGLERSLADPSDLITAIVTTSPAPVHPSTEHLEVTIASIRDRLPHAEIIIACDGVRPEQEHLREAYEDYVARVIRLAGTRWRNVLPVVLDEWAHQAGATQRALELVRSPLVLFCEHDTPLVNEIDFPTICNLVLSEAANVVRFHHESKVLPDHRHLFGNAETMHGVRVRKTIAFWARPHVARADWYRGLLSVIAPEARTMIEDVFYGVLHSQGWETWDDWRVVIYSPRRPLMQTSTHLDSRGEEPKHSMTWRYSGGKPRGAPNEVRDE